MNTIQSIYYAHSPLINMFLYVLLDNFALDFWFDLIFLEINTLVWFTWVKVKIEFCNPVGFFILAFILLVRWAQHEAIGHMRGYNLMQQCLVDAFVENEAAEIKQISHSPVWAGVFLVRLIVKSKLYWNIRNKYWNIGLNLAIILFVGVSNEIWRWTMRKRFMVGRWVIETVYWICYWNVISNIYTVHTHWRRKTGELKSWCIILVYSTTVSPGSLIWLVKSAYISYNLTGMFRCVFNPAHLCSPDKILLQYIDYSSDSNISRHGQG